jgi:hypothetical protein
MHATEMQLAEGDVELIVNEERRRQLQAAEMHVPRRGQRAASSSFLMEVNPSLKTGSVELKQ